LKGVPINSMFRLPARRPSTRRLSWRRAGESRGLPGADERSEGASGGRGRRLPALTSPPPESEDERWRYRACSATTRRTCCVEDSWSSNCFPPSGLIRSSALSGIPECRFPAASRVSRSSPVFRASGSDEGREDRANSRQLLFRSTKHGGGADTRI
jgi:hypothetical protein